MDKSKVAHFWAHLVYCDNHLMFVYEG